MGGATGIDGVTPGWTPTMSGLAGGMAFYVKASPSAEVMTLCSMRKDARLSIFPVDIVTNYLILASVAMPDNPVIRHINAFATDQLFYFVNGGLESMFVDYLAVAAGAV